MLGACLLARAVGIEFLNLKTFVGTNRVDDANCMIHVAMISQCAPNVSLPGCWDRTCSGLNGRVIKELLSVENTLPRFFPIGWTVREEWRASCLLS